MENDRLLRIDDVSRRTGFCKSHIYALMSKDAFPRPVGLGRTRRWRQSDINAFIASLPVVGTDGRLK